MDPIRSFPLAQELKRVRLAQERTCTPGEASEIQIRLGIEQEGSAGLRGWYRPRWGELRVRQALRQISRSVALSAGSARRELANLRRS